jgi:hypothetical protein
MIYFINHKTIDFIYSENDIAITRYKYVERKDLRFDVKFNENKHIESLYRQDTEEDVMLENISKSDFRTQYNQEGVYHD